MPPWQSHIYLVLPHSRQPLVLMLPEDQSWTLPHLRYDGRIVLANIAPIPQLMQQYLGVRTTVLRRAFMDEVQNTLNVVYVLENHSPEWTPPPGCQWVGHDALGDLPFAISEHRAVIATYLDDVTFGAVPELRAPWARLGWFAAAQSWMESQLDRLDMIRMAPIEQVRTWGISCILRVRTMSGDVYLKVSSTRPLFAREAVLVQALATLFPDRVPVLLAIDAERGMMLLADFGHELRGNTDVQSWENALCTFARLQRKSTAYVEELLTQGCRDRRLDTLAVHMEYLLGDAEALSALQPEEVVQLRRLVPRLRAMCDELGAYRVPTTLVHGDLHPGNIAVCNDTFVFFDWTDACVAHPFFDLSHMLLETRLLTDPNVAHDRLLEAYLDVWTHCEPKHRLRQAWTLARPLAALHQAISFQYMVAGLETAAKPELAWGIAFWLRQLLHLMSL